MHFMQAWPNGRGRIQGWVLVLLLCVSLTDPFGISATEARGAEEDAVADFLLPADPRCHKITDHYRYQEQVTWVNNATCTHGR